MKTELEQAIEEQRVAEIEDAQARLSGKALNDEIVRINQRVSKWKIENPELVKDEIPF